jgi:hypothetical protein
MKKENVFLGRQTHYGKDGKSTEKNTEKVRKVGKKYGKYGDIFYTKFPLRGCLQKTSCNICMERSDPPPMRPSLFAFFSPIQTKKFVTVPPGKTSLVPPK